MTWEQQLEQWRRHLDDHVTDPALIAAAQRIGKALAGDAE